MTTATHIQSTDTARPTGVWITAHALARWVERVDGEASELAARSGIEQLTSTGSWLKRPRRWMHVHDRSAHCVVSPDFPGVAVIVVGDRALTVIAKGPAPAARAAAWRPRRRHGRLQRSIPFNPRSLRGLEAIVDA